MRLALPSRSSIGLCACLALAMPAQADPIGEYQYLYTAFIDIDALFPNTLRACEQVDPATVEALRSAYAEWKATHAPYQAEVRQLVTERIRQRVGAQQVDEVIRGLTQEANTRLAAVYFPQNYRFKGNYFCAAILPANLRGEDLMIKFKDYVEELKKPAPRP